MGGTGQHRHTHFFGGADRASGVHSGQPKLNHAIHMAAVTQIRNSGTPGWIYFERKVAEGKTKKEALRSLKRQTSNAVYRQLIFDAQ